MANLHFGGYGAVNAKDLESFNNKLHRISMACQKGARKGPEAAAKQMVLQMKRTAPHASGLLRDQTYAMKVGKSYVVQSSRLSPSGRSIHAWVNEDIILKGKWYRDCLNKTGTPGYFDNAVTLYRPTAINVTRKYVNDALKIKI